MNWIHENELRGTDSTCKTLDETSQNTNMRAKAVIIIKVKCSQNRLRLFNGYMFLYLFLSSCMECQATQSIKVGHPPSQFINSWVNSTYKEKKNHTPFGFTTYNHLHKTWHLSLKNAVWTNQAHNRFTYRFSMYWVHCKEQGCNYAALVVQEKLTDLEEDYTNHPVKDEI